LWALPLPASLRRILVAAAAKEATMAQRNPTPPRGQRPEREHGTADHSAPVRRPATDTDKDDEHRAPESGEKPEASSSGDEPARDPDEV
jgi:hypothetical protein